MSCCDGAKYERDARTPAARMDTTIKGLARIAVGELTRGIRPLTTRMAYSRICLGCDTHTRRGKRIVCGELGVDQSEHPEPSKRSCGCFVDPAGKPRYENEWCPQGKWPATLTVERREP